MKSFFKDMMNKLAHWFAIPVKTSNEFFLICYFFKDFVLVYKLYNQILGCKIQI